MLLLMQVPGGDSRGSLWARHRKISHEQIPETVKSDWRNTGWGFTALRHGCCANEWLSQGECCSHHQNLQQSPSNKNTDIISYSSYYYIEIYRLRVLHSFRVRNKWSKSHWNWVTCLVWGGFESLKLIRIKYMCAITPSFLPILKSHQAAGRARKRSKSYFIANANCFWDALLGQAISRIRNLVRVRHTALLWCTCTCWACPLAPLKRHLGWLQGRLRMSVQFHIQLRMEVTANHAEPEVWVVTISGLRVDGMFKKNL